MPEPVLPIVKTPDQITPGRGGLVIPHEQTFASVYNLIYNQYPFQFDEALLDNIDNAIAMRFDPVIMYPLTTRKMATSQLTWHLDPEDSEDEDQVQFSADLESRIRRMPWLQNFLMTLMDAIWFGRSGSQVVYKWKRTKSGVMGLIPINHFPIDGDKLIFKYDGTVGLRVNALFDGPNEISQFGRAHFFYGTERQALVIHRHIPEDASYFRPMKSGGVHGQGLRERLYWFWAMKNQTLGLLADYLRWFAQGITIFWYPAGDPVALNEFKKRAAEDAGKPFMFLPLIGNQEPKNVVQRFDPSTASTQLMTTLVTSYFDETILKMILGQTLTSDTAPTGMGSGVAGAHMNTFDQIVKFDATNLQDTLTQDFVSVINAWTYPGNPCPRWVFEIDSTNVDQLINASTFFTQNGGKLGEESMRKLLGLPAIKPGESILGGMNSLDPTAVSGTPEGVPMYDQQNQNGGQEGMEETPNLPPTPEPPSNPVVTG